MHPGMGLESLVFDALMVVLALFLVALNGLFVAAEFAFVKIRATQVDRLVQQGRATARLVKDATRRLDAYLSVCQLGITISSLGLGWIGEPAFAHILEPILDPLGVPEGSVHVIAFAAAFGTITFLHVVFGELAPKSVAIARAEETALFIAPFMKLFYYLFLPGIYLFNGTANAVVRLFGVPPPPRPRRPTPRRKCGSSSSSPPSGAFWMPTKRTCWRPSSRWRRYEHARSWFRVPTS